MLCRNASLWFRDLKAFDGRSRFSTWLTRIAINAALMKLRKGRASREVPVEDPVGTLELHAEHVLADSSLNPEESCAKSEQKAILRDAITKLRPSLRKAIEVYQLQESSLPETAEVLAISIPATNALLPAGNAF